MVWKKLSATALSQQSPLRLILCIIPYCLTSFAWLSEQYWLPLSVCQISPLRGLRCHIAISKALLTRSAFILLLIDQPITFLENRSITVARYNLMWLYYSGQLV